MTIREWIEAAGVVTAALLGMHFIENLVICPLFHRKHHVVRPLSRAWHCEKCGNFGFKK